MAAVVLLGLGGLAGANVIVRVTDAIRAAETEAAAAATRALAGDTEPCDSVSSAVIDCVLDDDGSVTLRLVRDGVTASAIAGPER